MCLPCTPGRAQVSVLVPEMQATAMSSPALSLISVWVTACGSQHLVMYSICMEELLLSLDSITVNWGKLHFSSGNVHGITLMVFAEIWSFPFSVFHLVSLPSDMCSALLWSVPGCPQLPCGTGSCCVPCSTEHLAVPAAGLRH